MGILIRVCFREATRDLSMVRLRLVAALLASEPRHLHPRDSQILGMALLGFNTSEVLIITL